MSVVRASNKRGEAACLALEERLYLALGKPQLQGARMLEREGEIGTDHFYGQGRILGVDDVEEIEECRGRFEVGNEFWYGLYRSIAHGRNHGVGAFNTNTCEAS